MRRARYQRGSLRLRGRSDGPKVWGYRWREIQTDGTTSNPITSVRQSAKRQKVPEILTVDEL